MHLTLPYCDTTTVPAGDFGAHPCHSFFFESAAVNFVGSNLKPSYSFALAFEVWKGLSFRAFHAPDYCTDGSPLIFIPFFCIFLRDRLIFFYPPAFAPPPPEAPLCRPSPGGPGSARFPLLTPQLPFGGRVPTRPWPAEGEPPPPGLS